MMWVSEERHNHKLIRCVKKSIILRFWRTNCSLLNKLIWFSYMKVEKEATKPEIHFVEVELCLSKSSLTIYGPIFEMILVFYSQSQFSFLIWSSQYRKSNVNVTTIPVSVKGSEAWVEILVLVVSKQPNS